ncbi:glycosyl hydrolase [Arthrobacter sp. StoSoilB5]|uniref:glycosyl hydrolase n=1 Tax=Arthrobacter sp. StoSoilB5 TaxID=2830992 RepID=UPI001CC6E90E|nr:glycosyl hydrolase [Arthrobacter sp. StoSoilB5]BCW44865.1 hypothetical protein StoSoilB5_20490 [Arthrobacter sp. StoSoilB5]
MTSSALRQLFSDPPRTYGPTPLWWWSGGEVTRERLEWQMRRFAEGGIHNLVVINLAPAGPIVDAQTDDPVWFSEKWWDRFILTCELALELDMKIWFYDQIGFSGANVQGTITHRHPEDTGRTLRSRWTGVREGHVDVAAVEELIGAYGRSGERLDVGAEGQVTAKDGTSVRIVVAVPTAFDYLNQTAVGHLIDLIHGEFERRVPQFLGNVIAGSFQDELPATNAWTPSFPEEFRSRKGYDLLDYLPALFETGGDQNAKVRGDYYAVRGELTEEALFKPLGTWHSERGMMLGADQSNPARAGNPTQATQLYTDYFRTHRWYSAVGSDHEGDAKIHSSMAHLYGHERVWMESFHSSGWGATLEDTYDWLLPMLRSGANLYNPHASYFGTAAGWFEWAPPSTDWRQPYWKQYPAFSRAVARIASIMSWGTYCAEVAVLHPTATAQAALTLDARIDHYGNGQLSEEFTDANRAQEEYLALCGVNNWFTTRLGALDSSGISFDVIDDDSLQRSSAENGGLSVASQHYQAVIVPSAVVLEEETARRLNDLLHAGGRVLLTGSEPRLAAGFNGDDEAVTALCKNPRIERHPDPASAVGALAGLKGYATSEVPLLVRRDGSDAVALVTAAFPNASTHPLRTYDAPRLWEDYDFDPSRYARTRTVTINGTVTTAEVWNPATGESSAVPVQVLDSTSRIEVPLCGAPAVILTWSEGDEPCTADLEGPPESRTFDVGEGWTGTLVPTMANDWGDFAEPASSSVDDLQLWKMQWSQDGGTTWSPAKVTYGNRVTSFGAVPTADAPEPLAESAVDAVLAGEVELAGPGWDVHEYSASRGLENPGPSTLGNKGLVTEEFIRVASPGPGEIARIRTIVRVPQLGPAELVLGAGAAKRAWWNGREVGTDSGRYLFKAPVEVARELNVLEYELGQDENIHGPALLSGAPPLGSFFTLTAPGTFGSRPEFMSVPPALEPNGRVSYRGRIKLPSQARHATLVVGAATGASVLVDGKTFARQEKVEYYESDWGANPMFFSHDVTALMTAGEHSIEIVADGTDARDVVYVDLAAHHGEKEVSTLVSGSGWTAQTGGVVGATVEHRGHWSELLSAHAARRPHPLPFADWLNGAPDDGEPVIPSQATTDMTPRPQLFRIPMPAGTASAFLPLALPAVAEINGADVKITSGRVSFDPPLQRAADLFITTSPTALLRGGSAWTGPVVADVTPISLAFGDLRNLGLGAWSGGLSYRRIIDVGTQIPAILDLGRVRGSVEVTVNDSVVGQAFCAPFRFDLGVLDGPADVTVTVYNTLAHFLEESTPTSWVFPSQRASGIFGPVTLTVTE